MIWFIITELIIALFAEVPPLNMIEGAFLKYLGIAVVLTWFVSQKMFDEKKPYSFVKSMTLYALRAKVSYAGKAVRVKCTLCRLQQKTQSVPHRKKSKKHIKGKLHDVAI